MIPGNWSTFVLARTRGLFRLTSLVLLLLVAGAAQAQFNNGAIAGTLHDNTGAVIPHATVTIRNVDTGVTTELKTNGDGAYEALALIPGVIRGSEAASGGDHR